MYGVKVRGRPWIVELNSSIENREVQGWLTLV